MESVVEIDEESIKKIEGKMNVSPEGKYYEKEST